MKTPQIWWNFYCSVSFCYLQFSNCVDKSLAWTGWQNITQTNDDPVQWGTSASLRLKEIMELGLVSKLENSEYQAVW